jgi:homoserine kinase
MGLVRLLERLRPGFGLDVAIHKGIPIGSGLGSSAASAVASAAAASAVLDAPLSLGEQLHVALTGEAVASGAWHADNVAPMLYGGLVLTRAFDPEGVAPPDVVRIPVPTALRCVLVRPHQRLETRRARTVLPAHVPLADAVQQTANAAALVAGCYRHDLALVGRALRDVLVEPHRKALVPGFEAAQAAALDAGALGCSLSGAGPTTFAWCAGDEAAAVVRDAMTTAFAAAGYDADAWHGPVAADGARVVTTETA